MAQIFGYSKFIQDGVFDDDFFIERFLVNVGKLSRKYRKYGKLVIAADSNKRKYWRTLEFEHYKAGRYKDDSAKLSPKDLETRQKLREIPNKLEKVLKDNFPFYFIRSINAEADDVIATIIAHKFDEKHLILSADGDFVQLQRYNVDQWDTTRNRWLKSQTPELDLTEKIFRGDTGDGIPNILSDDDTLVIEAKRQGRMTQKKLKYLFNLDFDKMKSDIEYYMSLSENKEKSMEDFDNGKLVKRYFQNKKLIDLSETPLEVKEDILNQYREYGELPNRVMKYCMKNKYAHIFEHLNLFN